MNHINSAAKLREAILQLESAQAIEGNQLKQQFRMAYESVKPINLIKSTFKEVTTSQDLKDNLINAGIGITAGYLSKLLFVGMSDSPVKKLLGTALMFGITNIVARHPDTVKSVSTGVFNIVTHLGAKAIGNSN